MGQECCGEKSCSEEKDACCCSAKECCCNNNEDHGKMVMELANEAWSELMKEKMKTAYEKAMGEKMNKVAQVGVESCIGYWTNKMKEKHSWDEYEDKLKKAMM
ncbi:MAG: hypothetical protein AABX33_03565 [Nanoarchaeota archaeon]